MKTAEDCFAENITFLRVPQTDPMAWNTQKGLMGLAQQLARLERELAVQRHALEQIGQWIQQALPRAP